MIYAPDDTGRRIQWSAAKAQALASRACLLARRIYCNRIAAAAHAEVDPIQERTATGLVQAGTQRTQDWLRHAEKRLNKRDYRDRKSTRLNSSHANISYADFCLKKKNPRL